MLLARWINDSPTGLVLAADKDTDRTVIAT
jgi:hypothetical protein